VRDCCCNEPRRTVHKECWGPASPCSTAIAEERGALRLAPQVSEGAGDINLAAALPIQRKASDQQPAAKTMPLPPAIPLDCLFRIIDRIFRSIRLVSPYGARSYPIIDRIFTIDLILEPHENIFDGRRLLLQYSMSCALVPSVFLALEPQRLFSC